jgi:hypothetical protein
MIKINLLMNKLQCERQQYTITDKDNGFNNPKYKGEAIKKKLNSLMKIKKIQKFE